MIPKRRWPLQKVLDRRQDFHATEDYPQGWIEERLACGHVYRDDISTHASEHRSDVKRRRCVECAKREEARC